MYNTAKTWGCCKCSKFGLTQRYCICMMFESLQIMVMSSFSCKLCSSVDSFKRVYIQLYKAVMFSVLYWSSRVMIVVKLLA